MRTTTVGLRSFLAWHFKSQTLCDNDLFPCPCVSDSYGSPCVPFLCWSTTVPGVQACPGPYIPGTRVIPGRSGCPLAPEYTRDNARSRRAGPQPPSEVRPGIRKDSWFTFRTRRERQGAEHTRDPVHTARGMPRPRHALAPGVPHRGVFMRTCLMVVCRKSSVLGV